MLISLCTLERAAQTEGVSSQALAFPTIVGMQRVWHAMFEVSRSCTRQGEKVSFETFDILTDEDVRQGLKTYSNWPTFPQARTRATLLHENASGP
eukprot:4632348-Pleurochrysis_carterae.AAC.3